MSLKTIFSLLPFLLFIGAAFAQQPTLSPDKVVANLYRQHAKQSPFFQTKSRALLDTYFTKKLADLIWKDAVTAKGEIGALDADPLYNAQDTAIKKFAIQPAAIQRNNATVKVTFENYGEKQTFIYLLVRESNSWKIDNITYNAAYSLLKILQPGK